MYFLGFFNRDIDLDLRVCKLYALLCCGMSHNFLCTLFLRFLKETILLRRTALVWFSADIDTVNSLKGALPAVAQLMTAQELGLFFAAFNRSLKLSPNWLLCFLIFLTKM